MNLIGSAPALVQKDETVLFSVAEFSKLLEKRRYGRMELEHTQEVINFAMNLCGRLSGLNKDQIKIVLLAAILHDSGQYLEDPELKHHTDIGLNNLRDFLHPELLKYVDQVEKIVGCIQKHSMGGKNKPESLEEKIIFDADNLTIFTNFGYKRCFFKAEDWGKCFNLQDADSAYHEISKQAEMNKFFYLPESLNIFKETFYFKNKLILD